MGKYIIDLESGTHIFMLGPEGIVHIGEPDVVYETFDGMQIGDAVINAKPYIEPDLERVKKTAHDDGYSEGYQAGREDLNRVMSDIERVKEEAYLKGLNDGQGVIFESTQNNAFNNGYKKCLEDMDQVRKEAYSNGYDDGYNGGRDTGLADAWDAARKIQDTGGNLNWWIHNTSASEAIEKIRQYEQRQEEQIQVGDEVTPIETEYDDMIVTRLWKDDYDSDCIDAIGFDGRIGSFLVSRVSKTGKHYEIAAVLEKMRGEQEQ